MKALSFFSPGRYGCIIGVINALLAVGLTVLSFRYVQPKDCYRSCAATEGIPCPTGGCQIGEQKAGWPLPVFVDDPGGGSPTGGWGLLGPEDPPLFVPLLLDILFYSSIVWLASYLIQLIGLRTLPLKWIVTLLPLNVFLAVSLWIFYWLFGYYVPIGRGQSVQVYTDTATGIMSDSGFSPRVSIPLEELIENYGNPDNAWLMSEGTSEKPKSRMVLHWDSIGMFVELPEVANNTYTVKKTTAVEMILFPHEEMVLGIEGKPLGEKRTRWTGYGKYLP